MITAIIVDDEEPAREELKYLLGQDPDFTVVGEASDGAEAYEKIHTLNPQVLFLDVQMPELDGFGLAGLLMQKEGKVPMIVFTTAYDQYAVKAFEHAALDYVLKPIKLTRLQQTLQRIKDTLAKVSNANADSTNSGLATAGNADAGLGNVGLPNAGLANTGQPPDWQSQLAEFISKLQKPDKLGRLPVVENEKVILLQPEEVIYVESQGRGTNIITAQTTYHSDYSLGELEEKLREFYFFKTHRSYLVNLKEVREVIPWFNNTLLLKLKGTTQEIPVSRTFIKDFKQHISI